MTQIKKAPYIAAMALGPIFMASCNVEIAPQNDNIMSPQIERGADGVSLTYNAPFDNFIIDNSNSFPIASDQTNNYALMADKDVNEIIFTDGVYKDGAFAPNAPLANFDVSTTVQLVNGAGPSVKSEAVLTSDVSSTETFRYAWTEPTDFKSVFGVSTCIDEAEPGAAISSVILNFDVNEGQSQTVMTFLKGSEAFTCEPQGEYDKCGERQECSVEVNAADLISAAAPS